MNAELSDTLGEVVWFRTFDSQTVEGNVHIWVTGGMNIPRFQIGDDFHECIMVDVACCGRLNVFCEDWAYASGNTERITHHTCGVYSRIEISWSGQIATWLQGGWRCQQRTPTASCRRF